METGENKYLFQFSYFRKAAITNKSLHQTPKTILEYKAHHAEGANKRCNNLNSSTVAANIENRIYSLKFQVYKWISASKTSKNF